MEIFLVQVSTRKLSTLTEVYSSIPQSLRVNTSVIPRIGTWILPATPPTSFPVHYSLIMLSVDAVYEITMEESSTREADCSSGSQVTEQIPNILWNPCCSKVLAVRPCLEPNQSSYKSGVLCNRSEHAHSLTVRPVGPVPKLEDDSLL